MASTLPLRPSTAGNASISGHARQSSFNSTVSRSASNASGPPRIPPKSVARRGGSSSSVQSPISPSLGPLSRKRPRKMRKVKSQYPMESTERHVEYILVASFDIDMGPTMEHQYPGAISGDETMLAELMLPDQAHVRSEDWTMFFLHKDTSEEEELREERRLERLQRREERQKAREAANGDEQKLEEIEEDTADEDEDDGGEGPPLIYVLNLVNTKQDNNYKRGAMVKTMAICTRHPFLHIYKAKELKPLLLLALEEYFKSPFLETLEQLYNAVNAMDLSLMPRLSPLERQILLASDGKDLFIEKFDQMIQQKMLEENTNPGEPLGDSPTKQTFDSSRHQHQKQLPRDTHEYETRVMYNSIPIPIKIPTAISPETVGDFSTIKLIQTFATPHLQSPQPFMLHPHLTTSGAYTHPIIVLLNAILTQKRIIFLGFNRPSGEVAEAVLAACALVSGTLLRGFTRHAFPYTDLTKIENLLNVPGFIAGVTNPAFANHPEWWDLLCDIPTGRMKISSRIEPALPTEGLLFFQQQHPSFAPSSTGALPPSSSNPPGSDPVGDNAFMDRILRSISARHGEIALRSKWRDYILKFVRLAAAFEEAVYGASALFIGAAEADGGAYGVSGHGYVWPDDTTRARELGAHVWRIEGWRNTRSYYAFIQDIAVLFSRRPIRNMDITHQVDRLRALKLTHEESAKIYLALSQAINSYDEICQLLTATPENHGGLFHLSLGLFHPDVVVREATAELLYRIKEHEAGRHFWAGLGRFAKVAFWRIWRDPEGKSDVAEINLAEQDRRDGVSSTGSNQSQGNGWRARGPLTNGVVGSTRLS